MTTVNISLPDPLKTFVDDEVAARGFGTSSEYIRDLIRREQERQVLRRLVLDGAEAPATTVADAAYFEDLTERTRRRAAR